MPKLVATVDLPLLARPKLPFMSILRVWLRRFLFFQVFSLFWPGSLVPIDLVSDWILQAADRNRIRVPALMRLPFAIDVSPCHDLVVTRKSVLLI